MEKYTVDFTNVKTRENYYNALISGLKFPSWCGKNPDAIWDMMTGYIDYPASITVINLNALPKDFDEDKGILLEMFEDLGKRYKEGKFVCKFIDN